MIPAVLGGCDVGASASEEKYTVAKLGRNCRVILTRKSCKGTCVQDSRSTGVR